MEGGVDAGGDALGLAGALVGVVGPGFAGGAVGAGLAEALELAIAELDDAAFAAPCLDGVVELPPGVVDGEDEAVPCGVLGALVGARGVVVEEVREGALGGLDALPLAFGVGGPEVGVVDDLEASRAAELGADGLAGLGVDDVLTAPPAALDEVGAQLVAELFEGGAVGEGGVDGGTDVDEEVEFHGLGDGEGGLVLLLPDVAVVEADLVALGAEVVDGFLRGEELEGDHGARCSQCLRAIWSAADMPLQVPIGAPPGAVTLYQVTDGSRRRSPSMAPALWNA